MEPITPKKLITKTSLSSFSNAEDMWRFASTYVALNRANELQQFWQGVEKAGERLTEHIFVREHMWCCYVAGFTAATIAKKFPNLLLSHKIEDKDGNYLPIVQENLVDPLSPDILSVFGNRRKAASVQRMRAILLKEGWNAFYESICVWHTVHYSKGRSSSYRTIEPDKLTGLPGIGPALACHLARNLGNKNVVKPDVHLKRLAEKYGFADVHHMCRSLSVEPVGKTDLVLWLASVDNSTL